MSRNTALNPPALGEVAIYTYPFGGKVIHEYLMYRTDEDGMDAWFGADGSYVAKHGMGHIQPIPSAADLHATLALPDPLAFTPQHGDVAVYKTASGVPVTIQYRRDHSPRGIKVLAWFNESGRLVLEPETDPSFRLILRDGVLQEGAI